MERAEEILRRKIKSLTPGQLGKVEKLVSSLQTDDQHRAALSLSEPSFAQVWSVPENDAYDAL